MIRIIGLLLCIAIYGCENGQRNENDSIGKYDVGEYSLRDEAEMVSDQPPAPPPAEYALEKGSKIIMNGDMTFEVDKLELVKAHVDSLLLLSKGFYENEVFNARGNRNTHSLTLRIPTARFDSFVKVLESGIGDLKSKNIRAKDVTEEYVDLNIRLENNLSYLQQYKSILKKATTIKGILNVQEKIRRIEEEIESKKGRLKFLDDKVKFSTLRLELSELISREIASKPNFAPRMVNAFRNGIDGFLGFIISLVSVWPFVILGVVLLWGRKRIISIIRGLRKRSE